MLEVAQKVAIQHNKLLWYLVLQAQLQVAEARLDPGD